MGYYTINSLIIEEFISIILLGGNMLERVLGEVKGIFNIITWIEFILSIIYILLGLVFFSNPTTSNILVSIVAGLLLIGNGITSIISYVRRGGVVLFNNNLTYGISMIIIGIVAFFSGKILAIIFGIYLLVNGIQRINYGIFFKKYNESSWLLTLVIGILYIIIAIITFFTSGDAVIAVTGIGLLGFGLLNLINTILLRRRSKYFIA